MVKLKKTTKERDILCSTNVKFEQAVRLLPPKILSTVTMISQSEKADIQEIRLRARKKLTTVLFGKEYFITTDGTLKASPENAADITEEDISYTFKAAFQHSVHSFHRELMQGFITAEGGSRIGFCGTAVLSENDLAVSNVKNISSINIRIAKEVKGCSDELYAQAFSGGVASVIIAGPPASGKTTVLRDLCRHLGQTHRLSIIDERAEIAAVRNGISQNDIGVLSDVFDGYNKYDGIMTAVKVMSPEILVCDEIGAAEDMKALEYAVNSGVKLIVTCHAGNMDELKKRPVVSKLLKENIFDACAFLGTGRLCGKMTAFYRVGDKYA